MPNQFGTDYLEVDRSGHVAVALLNSNSTQGVDAESADRLSLAKTWVDRCSTQIDPQTLADHGELLPTYRSALKIV